MRPPNCVIAFVRAAESSTGWESADHRSNTAAVAEEAAAGEVTSVRGGGSCGDNMAATQHHAPGMFVPRVFATRVISSLSWTLFIRRHFLVGLISDECTLYLSVPQIRRDSQSNCQLVFLPFFNRAHAS